MSTTLLDRLQSMSRSRPWGRADLLVIAILAVGAALLFGLVVFLATCAPSGYEGLPTGTMT